MTALRALTPINPRAQLGVRAALDIASQWSRGQLTVPLATRQLVALGLTESEALDVLIGTI